MAKRQHVQIANLSSERLDEIRSGFSKSRIAVLGDFFLDKYLEVDPRLEETSVETGKPAHQVGRVRASPGAAGTVARNLATLGGGTIHTVGLLGDDGEGYELRRGLEALGCDVTPLVVERERYTPTYLKPRNMLDPTLAGEHSRYDTKNRSRTPPQVERDILRAVERLLPSIDALVVMDQVEESECGVVTRVVREALTDWAHIHPRVVFWADSRRRIHSYRGVTIKPNQFEAVGREHPHPGEVVDLEELRRAVEALRARNGAPVVTTLAERGVAVSDPVWTLIPGVRIPGEIDPTGAGDSVTAGAVLALTCGAALPEAAVIGNLVASITVEEIATTGAARSEDLPPRLALWRSQLDEAREV